MQQPLTSGSDKKDLDKFTKFLCLKAAQVIVQGRLGKPISSECTPMPSGAEWFNLAIKDYPEIQKEAKSALLEGNPTFHSSFVVEISLQTSYAESLLLEVWTLNNVKKYEDVRIHNTVYNRMSLLLKSLTCVSRAMPAYKLSRNQGSEYVICFRIYTGKADISDLGEGFKTHRIGSIGTPNGTLTLSVAFRTRENIHVCSRKLASGTGDQMKVSPDHFNLPKCNAMSPARPCHTLRSRIMNSKDISVGSLESGSYGTLPTSFSTSPCDLYMGSPRQKASMFTVGTPPTYGSYGRTPPSKSPSPLLSSSRRKLGDALPGREGRNFSFGRRQQPFHRSQSEQNFSDSTQSQKLQNQRRQTIQEDMLFRQTDFEDDRSSACSPKDGLMQCVLANGDIILRPTPYGSSDCVQSPALPKTSLSHSEARSLALNNRRKSSPVDAVMTLKSNSPGKAKVGFPDNAEMTLHLSHIPPSLDASSISSASTIQPSNEGGLYSLSLGAFVHNSKTAKRAHDRLHGASNSLDLPFASLMALDGGMETDKDIFANKSKGTIGDLGTSLEGNNSTLTSSQSSLSSHPSNEFSPQTDGMLKPISGSASPMMVDLNCAFVGKEDIAANLCSFYRHITNAADLSMFRQNGGWETTETFLDLTKQLDDFLTDAEDFDEFVRDFSTE